MAIENPAILIPIIFSIAIVVAIGIVMYFRTQRDKAVAAAGGDYRRLAEESIQAQRGLIEELQNQTKALHEIERLLKEV